MTKTLPADLLEATRLTTTGRLSEATAAIQRMLGGLGQTPARSPGPRVPPTIEGIAERIGSAGAGAQPRAALCDLMGKMGAGGFKLPGVGLPGAATRSAPVEVPDGAQFLAATFANEAGSRSYKLYVPSGYRSGQPVPLIVMLHGCTQSPDDFAAGTRMNDAAEARTCLVVYPGQTGAANMQKCWNWFNEGDQERDAGEPSLIAGITRQVMRDYDVDPRRVYVAGLSAGGAAAAIMGNAYPDLYAAIGVHSGLASGAAHDMPSAFAAMRQGGATRQASAGDRRQVVPAIVFHGDRDTTVNPRNGDAVIRQASGAFTLGMRSEEGQVPGGHSYSRTLGTELGGQTVMEQWLIHGAAHAWSGGSPAGSYTDPRGPDATGEMLRFFLEHPKPGRAG